MDSIAHRLRELRRELGLGTRPFAERIRDVGYDVRHTTVSSYERETGTEKIPAAYLAAVCRAFGVSPEWLLVGREPMYPLPGAIKERGFEIIAGVVGAISGAAEQGGEAAELALRQRLIQEMAALERAERTQKSS